MKPTSHVMISAVVSAGYFSVFKSWPGALLCMISGVLIDVDHHLDYVFAEGKFPWRYKDLVDHCTGNQRGKIYLVFHGYEQLFILWGIISIVQPDVMWIGFSLGATVHLICDQFANPIKPFTYLFFYRLKHKFDPDYLMTNDYHEKIC